MTTTWRAARLALGTACALGFARFAYGLLIPGMREDLHWTLAQAGAVSTANGLGYLLGAIATAAAVHRWGVATVFRTSMIATTITLTATATDDTIAVQAIVRALAGVSGAAVFVTGGIIAARMAAEADSGTPITIYFSGTGLGIILSGSTVPFLDGRWQAASIGMGIAAGVATLACWTAARGSEAPVAEGTGRVQVRGLRTVVVAYFLFAAGYISYITFLSVYLDHRHASNAEAALVWTVLGAAVMAAPLVWSRPIADWRGTRALTAVLGAHACGAALALLPSSSEVWIASAAIYGATFMTVAAAVTARIRAVVPPESWTTTLAAFTTVFAAGQMLGPWLAGLLADRTSTTAAVVWTVALCAAAAAITAIPIRSRTTP